MVLNLSDFVLERVAFEVKFPEAYVLWDKAGSIWTEARRNWPSLKALEATPSKTIFRLEGQYEMGVEMESARAISFNPRRSLDDFVRLLSTFMIIVTESLSLSVLSRIGVRFIYFKKYPDRDSASAAMVDTNLLRIPDPSAFGADFKVVLPEYVVRYEAKGKGFSIRMRAEGRRIDFEPLIVLDELKPVHQETDGLAYDIDYFTTAPMAIDQFNVAEWVPQASHVVRQISGNFLSV